MKHARSDYDHIQDPSGKIPNDEPEGSKRSLHESRTQSPAERLYLHTQRSRAALCAHCVRHDGDAGHVGSRALGWW